MTDFECPILLVEDDVLDAKSVERAFRLNGIQNPLHICPNGEAALEYLRERVEHSAGDEEPTPRLILLDINMPVMDGMAFIREVRTQPEHRFTPILILTTEGGVDRKQEGKEAGANGWIVKPFDPSKLVRVVNRVVA